jgi:bacterioferritin
MKGNDKIIEKLNYLLAEELTAINQYMIHSEMCANWRYERLHDAIEKRAVTEMKHAEKLIGRILFLSGNPIVSKLNPIHIGINVEEQFHNDLEAELAAVVAYNNAIHLAVEVSDNGSRELLGAILVDEEDHVDWVEAQLDQISHMGLGVYLGQQVD